MMRRFRHYLWLWIGLLAGATILLGVAACFFPQQILTVDSGPAKADAMVVLGGAWLDRPQRAAELFKDGEAPKIIVTGYGDCVSNEHYLEKYGVPGADIALERNAHTTRENAEFTIPMLRQMGAKRVILVTSWYHSRRALACFEHYAPDMKFYSRPSYLGYKRADWKHKNTAHDVASEYFKLLGYRVCYGVCPI